MKQTGKTIHLITAVSRYSNAPIYMLIDYETNSSTEWTSTPSPDLIPRKSPIPYLLDGAVSQGSLGSFNITITTYQVHTTLQEEYPELFI